MFLIASSKSVGKKINFKGKEYSILDLEKFDFSNVEIAFFSAGSIIAEKWAIKASEKTIVIDNSKFFRKDPDIPLVVPEVNAKDLSLLKNKNIKMREDLQCFTRILNLIAHWEAGRDYNLDKIIRETYNYLDKMNDLHEVQKTILKYLNGLENIYPGEIKGFLRSLHSELKKFEDDPYEKRAFLYLDIISWLESKINNKPVAVIIKEKALLINRKEKQTIALI